MTIIGIDPAFRKRGFTIAIISDKKIVFKSFKEGFRDFLEWLKEECPHDAVIGIENSNLQKKVFVPSIARGVSVGKNQAASQYTVDACRMYFNKTTYEWSPKEKGQKLNHKEVVGLCNNHGWILPKKTTNQDERDALKMADLAWFTYRRNDLINKFSNKNQTNEY